MLTFLEIRILIKFLLAKACDPIDETGRPSISSGITASIPQATLYFVIVTAFLFLVYS